MDAEKAYTKVLTQHKSSKGYYCRVRAWKMFGQTDDALKGKSYLFSAHILLTDVSFVTDKQQRVLSQSGSKEDAWTVGWRVKR